METLKKIISRLALFATLFMLLNFIYKKTLWKSDLDKHADMLWELHNKQDTCDVLYFGESSDFHSDSTDLCKKAISELTSEYYPELRFGTVSRPALHAGIYLSVIKNLSPSAKVKTVIFTMNMRSFDATWIHSSLESALQKSNIMYQTYPALANRFLLSLNAYEDKTEEERDKDMKAQWTKDEFKFPYPFKYKNVIEWDQGMANGGYLNADGSWDMPRIELATHYIKAYAFQINSATNPRIKDFDAIVKVCKEKELNVVFNILAENMQYADSLVGKDLIYLMKENRDLLVNRYRKDGVLVVDNLELVNGKDFIDQKWTNEHYNENGRKMIAKNLAEQMKPLLKGFEEK